ncbi:MAG: magnesium/cobalt transporter CorA [Desulfomonile tiedjei]|nr:magnesium/cobalt transporter CorA [Desulfomonile tiedjei]
MSRQRSQGNARVYGPGLGSRFRAATKKRARKSGLPPGTVVHVGKERTEKVRISVIDYDEANAVESEVTNINELHTFLDKPTVTWINIDGVHDLKVIENIGHLFNLHPLIMEDIANTTQRPKAEDLEDYLFIVFRVLEFDEGKGEINSEQISLILGSNYLISFQENREDLFDPIRERIRASKGRIRKGGPDYLAYALLDSVVDNYFVLLEKLGEKLEFLEEELVKAPAPDTLQTIHKLKTYMIFMRKSVWPLREVINRLLDGESPLIKSLTMPYLRDVYDHTIHVIDTMETSRDIISGMLDIYLSSISYRLNEIMKVLTIIATLFIPLTFLVGWYGMNFKSMPEYEWRYGYAWVISIALCMVFAMLVYFKRKRWW